MIARPDVPRGIRSWVERAVLYTLACCVAAAASGATFGLLGGVVESSNRIALATVLACVGVALGVARLAGARVIPLQCDRETPQRWLAQGLRVAAVKNGLALGSGATTRVGFLSWYITPVAAFALGDPFTGAVLYGTYGLVRGGSAWVWIALSARAHRLASEPSDLPAQILRWGPAGSYLGAAQLTVVAVAMLVSFGF